MYLQGDQKDTVSGSNKAIIVVVAIVSKQYLLAWIKFIGMNI